MSLLTWKALDPKVAFGVNQLDDGGSQDTMTTSVKSRAHSGSCLGRDLHLRTPTENEDGGQAGGG